MFKKCGDCIDGIGFKALRFMRLRRTKEIKDMC